MHPHRSSYVRDIYRVTAGFVLFALLVWSLPVIACGCGVLIRETETADGWSYGDDTTEYAFITHNNGIEHLLLSIDIKTRDRGAVLVTPIPAAAEKVVADILAETPDFSGYDIALRAERNLEGIQATLMATQLYPIPLWIVGEMFATSFGMETELAAVPTSKADDRVGVDVYQHIEKEGMIAEVLSAKTSDALYEYLTAKGLHVAKDSIPIFRDYIRDDYSFVVAWIDSTKDTVSAKSLSMSFPTDRIYYPLKPNSAYEGGQRNTKKILVAGYVRPLLYAGIDAEDDTHITYLYSEKGLSIKDVIDEPNGFGFTSITINADPQNMREDLYFSSVAPFRVYLAHAISMYPVPFGVALLFIIVYGATTFAVTVVKPQYRVEYRKRYKLIIANSLTLIGTIIGAHRYLYTKRLKYIVVFSLAFLFATWAIMRVCIQIVSN